MNLFDELRRLHELLQRNDDPPAAGVRALADQLAAEAEHRRGEPGVAAAAEFARVAADLVAERQGWANLHRALHARESARANQLSADEQTILADDAMIAALNLVRDRRAELKAAITSAADTLFGP